MTFHPAKRCYVRTRQSDDPETRVIKFLLWYMLAAGIVAGFVVWVLDKFGAFPK